MPNEEIQEVLRQMQADPHIVAAELVQLRHQVAELQGHLDAVQARALPVTGPAVVELMGHVRIVGRVSEVTQFGAAGSRSRTPRTRARCSGQSCSAAPPSTESVPSPRT